MNPFETDGSEEEVQVSVRNSKKTKPSIHRSLPKIRFKKKKPKNPDHTNTSTALLYDVEDSRPANRTSQKQDEKEMKVRDKLTLKQQVQEKSEQESKVKLFEKKEEILNPNENKSSRSEYEKENNPNAELLKKKDEGHRIILNKPSKTEYERENQSVLFHNFATKGKTPKKTEKKSKKNHKEEKNEKEEKIEIKEQLLPETVARPNFNTKKIEEKVSPVRPVTVQRISTNPFEDSDDDEEEEEEEEENEDQHIVPKKMGELEKNISPLSKNIEAPVQRVVSEVEKDDTTTHESLKRKRSSSIRRKMSKMIRKNSKSRSENKKSEIASETWIDVSHEVSRQSPESDEKTVETVSSISVRGGRPEKGKPTLTNQFDENDVNIEESIPRRNITSEKFLMPNRRDVVILPNTKVTTKDKLSQKYTIVRNPVLENVPKMELLKKKEENYRINQNKPSKTEHEKENHSVLVHNFASKGNIPKKNKSQKYHSEEKNEIKEQLLPETVARPSFNTKTAEKKVSPVNVLEARPITVQKISTNPFEDSDDDEEDENEDHHIVPKKMGEPEKNISPLSENIEASVQGVVTEMEKDDTTTLESLKRKRSSSVRRKMSKILRNRSKSQSENKKSEIASETQKDVTNENEVKIAETVSSVSGLEVRPEKGKRTLTHHFDEDDDTIEESIPRRNINLKKYLLPDRPDVGILPNTKVTRNEEMSQTSMVVRNPVQENVPKMDSKPSSTMVMQIDGEEKDSSAKRKKGLPIHRQLSRIHKSFKKKSEEDAKNVSPTDSSTEIEMTKMAFVESKVYSQPIEKHGASRPEETIAHTNKGWNTVRPVEERAIDVPEHSLHFQHPIDEREQVDDVLEIVDETTEQSNNGSLSLRRGFSKLRSSFKRKSKNQQKETPEESSPDSITDNNDDNLRKRNSDLKEGLITSPTDTSQQRPLSAEMVLPDPIITPRIEITPANDMFETSPLDEEKVHLRKKNPFQLGVSKVRSSFRRKSKNQQNEETSETIVDVENESTNLKNQESPKEEVELSPAEISPKRQMTVEEVLADLGCTPDGREINPTDDPFETSGNDEEKVNVKKKNSLQRGVSKVRSSKRRKSKNQQNEESTEAEVNDKDQSTNRQESVEEEVELPSSGSPQRQMTMEEVLADLGCTPDGREINPTDDVFEETAQDDENDGENVNGKNKNLLQRRVSKLRSSFKKKSKNPPQETLSDSTVIQRDRSTSETLDKNVEVYSPLLEPSPQREFTKSEVLSDGEKTTDISEKKSKKQKKKKDKKHDEQDTEYTEPLLKPITIERKISDDYIVEFRGPQKVPPSKGQLIEMRSTVDDVKQSLSDNLQKLEDRAGNLDELEALADSLTDKTSFFVKCSVKVKKKMRCRDYKWRIIIISSVSVIILVALLIFIVFITKNTDNTQNNTPITTNLTNIQNV